MPLSRIRTKLRHCRAGPAATQFSNAGALAENLSGFPNRGRAYNAKAAPRQRAFSRKSPFPAAARSPVLEGRFALLDEGGHAFFLVLGRKEALEQTALETQALF